MPKNIELPRRNEAEDTYEYIVRDRLEVVERARRDELDAASVKLLLEAETELELLQVRLRNRLSPTEKATYENLRARINRQKTRCGSEANQAA